MADTDPRHVARAEEEARQAAILEATEKRNQEIIDGADPDPNVGIAYDANGNLLEPPKKAK